MAEHVSGVILSPFKTFLGRKLARQRTDATSVGEAPGGDLIGGSSASLRLRALHAVLGRHRTVTLKCAATDEQPRVAETLTALDGRISHEGSPVHTIRGLLSLVDVARVHEAAAELQQRQKPHACKPTTCSIAASPPLMWWA